MSATFTRDRQDMGARPAPHSSTEWRMLVVQTTIIHRNKDMQVEAIVVRGQTLRKLNLARADLTDQLRALDVDLQDATMRHNATLKLEIEHEIEMLKQDLCDLDNSIAEHQ